ncbi:hypothetical protein Noda2021_11710 [Candidatus Dependentiae bacterium Noda2021]|nr:hypothetical protein Noda2021_11710 [Candidatus Dependentiae bacterium Noda2021]
MKYKLLALLLMTGVFNANAYLMRVINTTDGIVSVAIETTAGPTYTQDVDPSAEWTANTIGWCPSRISVSGVTGSTIGLSNATANIPGNRCRNRTIHITPRLPLARNLQTNILQYQGLNIELSN